MIVEMLIEDDNWLANRTLIQTRLRAEGIMILGINRQDGTYIGTPDGETKIIPGDVIMAYGRFSTLESLDRRRKDLSGALEHLAAITEQIEIDDEEEQEDPAAAGSS